MDRLFSNEHIKELKRLKNEPLLMLAIIFIILFTSYFVIWPVVRLMTLAKPSEFSVHILTLGGCEPL